jgi:hypothetical protein
MGLANIDLVGQNDIPIWGCSTGTNEYQGAGGSSVKKSLYAIVANGGLDRTCGPVLMLSLGSGYGPCKKQEKEEDFGSHCHTSHGTRLVAVAGSLEPEENWIKFCVLNG